MVTRDRSEYLRAWREAHPDKVAEYARRQRAKRAPFTPEQREARNAYNRQWWRLKRGARRQGGTS